MKKLMMTTVAALGFAALAQADVLNSTGFEEYGDKDFAVGRDDQGKGDNACYWFGTEGGDFTQTGLKTYEEAAIEAPANVPDAFKDAASNKTFLSVDTGNDVLLRRAANDPTLTIDLSSDGPVFFDADVKFTASETNVEATTGDKLLVWLKGDDTTTNLIVTAGLYNGTSGAYDKTQFIIDGDYSADKWYRLTVKATRVLSGDGENYTTAFNVYIDGELVTSGDTDLFYSLVQQTDKLATTIAEAGFQGTGALDNVVWTTTDPFPAEGTYTLKFTGDEGFGGEMVSVTVGGSNVVSAASFEKAGIGVSVKEVTVVAQSYTKGTVTPTTEAAGVTFSKVTMVETKVTNPEDPEESWPFYTYTFTVTVAEPAVGANYAIALSFVPGAVIDEDVDLTTQSKLSLDKDSIKEGEAAPTVTVMVGDNTLTVGTDYTVTTDYAAGTSKAGTYTITVTAVENSGYTGSKTITFTVTAEEVVPTEGEAAAGKSATVQAESEEAALTAVTVKVDDAVAAVLTPEQKATFADTFFTKTVVDNKDGTYTVSVAVKEGAVEAKLDEVVAEALETAADGEITKIPVGLCYKIESGSTVGLGTVAKGISTGAKIEVKGLSPEAGFYKVSLDVAPIE